MGSYANGAFSDFGMALVLEMSFQSRKVAVVINGYPGCCLEEF